MPPYRRTAYALFPIVLLSLPAAIVGLYSVCGLVALVQSLLSTIIAGDCSSWRISWTDFRFPALGMGLGKACHDAYTSCLTKIENNLRRDATDPYHAASSSRIFPCGCPDPIARCLHARCAVPVPYHLPFTALLRPFQDRFPIFFWDEKLVCRAHRRTFATNQDAVYCRERPAALACPSADSALL